MLEISIINKNEVPIEVRLVINSCSHTRSIPNHDSGNSIKEIKYATLLMMLDIICNAPRNYIEQVASDLTGMQHNIEHIMATEQEHDVHNLIFLKVAITTALSSLH